ncbi:MAG: ACT domain-containing protein [Candidatus Latescibacterota bacterium]
MDEQVIVTVVGKNRVGVLGEVTAAIADLNGNIMDISQKMMGDYFNLLMIVSIAHIKGDFSTFKETLEEMGNKRGYRLSVQHERAFQYMHRI